MSWLSPSREDFYEAIIRKSGFAYFMWTFRERFKEYSSEMYKESESWQNVLEDLSPHQFAELAREKELEALNLEYSDEAKAIVDGVEEKINQVRNIMIVISSTFSIIFFGSLYFLQLNIFTLVTLMGAVASLFVFPVWKFLIETDESAHQGFNNSLVIKYGDPFGKKRFKANSFAVMYWNAALKYKVGAIGMITLALLDVLHNRLLRGQFRDPIEEQMIVAGQNLETILEEEGVLNRVRTLQEEVKAMRESEEGGDSGS